MRSNALGRLLAGTLAALLLVGVAACGDDEGGADKGGSGGGAKPKREIAFITGVVDPFYGAAICGAMDTASKLGVELNIQEPKKYEPALQTRLLNAAVATKPDALVIAPNDPVAMQPPIKAAQASGVEVVVAFDGTLEDTSNLTSVVLSDALAGGEAALKLMGELAPKGGKVLVLSNQPGNVVQTARTKRFVDGAKQAGFSVLPRQFTRDDNTRTGRLLAATLTANPDLVGIYTTTGNATAAIATALEEAGRADDVSLISYDAGDALVKALQADQVDGLVAQRPDLEGRRAVEIAVAALDGKPLEKQVLTEVTTITKDNLDDPTSQAALYRDCR